MIPVKYENLCSVCGKDLSHKEIEKGRCENKDIRFYDIFHSDKEMVMENFFSKVVGKLREIQRFWIRRISREESFAMVAPTGIGKTTFGLVFSLFFSINGNKSYIIVPTTILVEQCVDILQSFSKKIGIKISMNNNDGLRIVFYHGKMKPGDKRKVKDMLRNGDFDILVTTSQFLSRNFTELKENRFYFIFVDDVDSVLKRSKNVDKIIYLLGFRKKGDTWLRKEKGILMVSTATVKRGVSTNLFYKLLNFDVGSSFFTVRNIDDIAIDDESVDRVRDILRRMGKGAIIYARSVDDAKKYHEILRKEFKIGVVVSGKGSKDYEKFERGELDYLIGTSYYYGNLVRGLDLPYTIRYVIFIGAPVFEMSFEQLTPKMVKILSLMLRKNERIRKYLHILPFIEKHPKELEILKSLVIDIIKKEKPDNIVVRENKIITPDIRTYLQGSGRSSRLVIHGLTKGASFLLEDDKELLNTFTKKAEYYNIFFKDVKEVDFEKLIEEIDNTRKAGKGVKDVIKPALFIVESPTKAKHIARFFGNPGVKLIDNIIVYEVPAERHILMITACLGHVTDLTVNRGFHGVDIINGEFIPVYTSIKRCRSCGYQTTASMNVCIRCGSEDIDDSKNRIESLRKIASETGFVIIGTDPDAEGEKIAWDLSNMFSGISTIKRAEFHEITYHAIKKALSELRDIDESLVKAQIIRRVEDRWIGFVLSSKLQQVFRRKNISAGRVQTPVLKWIIERSERFRKKKRIAYSPELGLAFEDVNQRELNVNVVIEEEREENKTPLPPYTTDEMLRDANNLLKISSGLAMSLAQDLFENGLITYHRTDSIYVSETGKKIAQDYLGKDFQGRTWAVSKHGAHECIRPTRPYEKETIQRMIYEGILHVENLTQQHLVLYDMIFRRFMASQCKDYRVKIKRYRIEYDESSMIDERIVQASGKAFELYRGVLVKKEIPTGKLKIRLRQVLVPEEYPYTQADVIKQMKDKMIGRPSTYSTIIEKLFLRKYVFEIKRRLFPTPLGRKVCDYLFSRYEKFVSEERTRKLQEKMDEIERGKTDYRDVMKEIYEEVTSDVF